jgi:hypothetical protein
VLIHHDRQWYQALLDRLYDSIEGLNVSAYSWAESDGWHRDRTPRITTAPLEHLEVWIELGGFRRDGSDLVYSATAVFYSRYEPDDDAHSQANHHAAANDLWDMLLTWTHADTRTSPQSMEDPVYAHGWIACAIRFYVLTPWRS